LADAYKTLVPDNFPCLDKNSCLAFTKSV